MVENNSNTSDVNGHGTKVSGAAAMVANNGNGSAGVAYTFRDLARARGIALIVDETYRDFDSRSGAPHDLFTDPDWSDTFIHLYSFSKAYRLTGHRVGAVVASVGLMMLFAGAIGRFVSNHPSIKMLALSFLVAVGVVLIAEGFGHHVPKGYIYFAMAFSLTVEMLNIRMRRRRTAAVHLHAAYAPENRSD